MLSVGVVYFCSCILDFTASSENLFALFKGFFFSVRFCQVGWYYRRMDGSFEGLELIYLLFLQGVYFTYFSTKVTSASSCTGHDMLTEKTVQV